MHGKPYFTPCDQKKEKDYACLPAIASLVSEGEEAFPLSPSKIFRLLVLGISELPCGEEGENIYFIKSWYGILNIEPSFTAISILGFCLPVSNMEIMFWLAPNLSAKAFWLKLALVLKSRIRAAV
ncbi:MAG: hypothetical protein FWG97_05655, partial [Deltaproteobacteria bacterium]|nr:hypothetical protein [Deltaproteobacteria bacterium]